MQNDATVESDTDLPLRRASRGRSSILAVAIVVGLVGCSGKIVTLHGQGSGVAVTAELKRVRKRDEGAFVFVDLTITGIGKRIASADLDCIVLHAGPLTSSDTYVDSIANVFADDYPARDGIVSAAAYWYFAQAKDVPITSLREASIKIREKSGEPCFQFK